MVEVYGNRTLMVSENVVQNGLEEYISFHITNYMIILPLQLTNTILDINSFYRYQVFTWLIVIYKL